VNWNQLHNKYQGETGLVIGNGPSLKRVSRLFLRRYPTFGTNKIYLLDDFTPTYYVAVNPLVIEQSIPQIYRLNSEAVFLPSNSGVVMENVYHLHSRSKREFSFTPDEYIYEGYTVTFVCLELAYFMGFKTVLLVGVDHNYQYTGEPNAENTFRGVDFNHFDPLYFTGHRWNNPDLKRSEEAYGMAKQAFEADGRRIVNLTDGTKLDVFEKGELLDWV
jgi:hypothetical protein